MGQTTFSGPVRSLAGFSPDGWGNIVNVASADFSTISLTAEDHGGRLISLTGDHSLTVTLPAINSTDPVDDTAPGQSCNFGLTFRLIISNDITSLTVNTTGDDEFFGGLTISTESDTTELSGATFFANDADNFNSLVIDSALKGWEPGGILEFIATDASGGGHLRWNITRSHLLGIGAVVTPFV